MRLTYDPAKRVRTLLERGLDFDDAVAVFADATIDALDDRRDYGEVRLVTYGMLRGRMVVIVWTARAGARQIISMRKANERERRVLESELG